MLFWKGWKSRQMKSRQWILQSSISDEYLDASFPRWMGTLMHKFTDRRVPGCIIVWMEEYPAASMFGRKSTWLHQCLDGRVTRCISSWMDVYPRKYGYAKWNTFCYVFTELSYLIALPDSLSLGLSFFHLISHPIHCARLVLPCDLLIRSCDVL
jgi:hypothetical protein